MSRFTVHTHQTTKSSNVTNRSTQLKVLLSDSGIVRYRLLLGEDLTRRRYLAFSLEFTWEATDDPQTSAAGPSRSTFRLCYAKLKNCEGIWPMVSYSELCRSGTCIKAHSHKVFGARLPRRRNTLQ